MKKQDLNEVPSDFLDSLDDLPKPRIRSLWAIVFLAVGVSFLIIPLPWAYDVGITVYQIFWENLSLTKAELFVLIQKIALLGILIGIGAGVSIKMARNIFNLTR